MKELDKDPKLEFAHLADIIIHEYFKESHSNTLADTIKAQGILRHPPIVAKVRHGKQYVHLDGANRLTALRLLGCRDALVQVVDYHDPSQVQLRSWCHLISLSSKALIDRLKEIDGLNIRSESPEIIAELLTARTILCASLSLTGEAMVIEGNMNLGPREILLNLIVNIYKEEHYREILEPNEVPSRGHSLLKIQNRSSLVIFSPFTPHEIETIALQGARIPTGITRHIITNRALNVNMPLERLAADESVDLKNKWLYNEFMKTKQWRPYQEPTMLLEDTD